MTLLLFAMRGNVYGEIPEGPLPTFWELIRLKDPLSAVFCQVQVGRELIGETLESTPFMQPPLSAMPLLWDTPSIRVE